MSVAELELGVLARRPRGEKPRVGQTDACLCVRHRGSRAGSLSLQRRHVRVSRLRCSLCGVELLLRHDLLRHELAVALENVFYNSSAGRVR